MANQVKVAEGKANGNKETKPVQAKNGEVQAKWNIRELSLEQADANIAKLVKSGKELRKLAHETAVGILLHYAEHGDYTRLQRDNDTQAPRLMEAINDAFSRSMSRAFVEWTVKYTSLRWNDETKRFYHNKRDKRIPEGKRGYIDMDCIDTPFFAMERDTALPAPVDFDKLLVNFVQRAERLLKQKLEGVEKDGKVRKIKHNISPEMVKDLEAFAKSHGVELQTAANN